MIFLFKSQKSFKIAAFPFISAWRELLASLWSHFLQPWLQSMSHPQRGMDLSASVHVLSVCIFWNVCSILLQSTNNQKNPDWKVTECMDCAVACLFFFCFTRAVLRKVEFQSDSDLQWLMFDLIWLPVGSLFFILASDVFQVSPCIFVRMWELAFKLRSKRRRCCIEQVWAWLMDTSLWNKASWNF